MSANRGTESHMTAGGDKPVEVHIVSEKDDGAGQAPLSGASSKPASGATAAGGDPRMKEKAFAALGILFAFICYGVFQERIMTVPWDGEMFRFSAFLVLCNRIVACISAATILKVQGNPVAPGAPMYKFFGISISNTFATLCQYEALKYVTFPTQTLGKTAKTIPVLILGTLLGGKKYQFIDYAVCVAITIGCSVFVLTGDITDTKAGPETVSESMYGILLMAGYLSFDGFTSVFQEKLYRGYNMPTYNPMVWVNFCSGIISIVWLMVTGELFPALQFASDHPLFFLTALGLASTSMLGQSAIYYTINNFGALFFATVMTVRQVFSITLSCILFFHPLTVGQLFGAAITLGAAYYRKWVPKKK